MEKKKYNEISNENNRRKKKPQKHLLNSFMNISSTFSFTS